MCLISYCPEGTDKNSDEVHEFIRTGMHTQRDGSGFMYKKKGENLVYLSKGYKNVEALIGDITRCNLEKDDILAIHHRTSTSGKTDDVNTHPFVVSKNHEEVITLEDKVDKPVFMHNGIFTLEKYEKMNLDFSDTYAFARYILTNPGVMNLYRNDPEMFQFALSAIVRGSRTLTFFPDRVPIMTGSYTEHNGYYHSNDCFRNLNARDRGGAGHGVGKNTTNNGGGLETNVSVPNLPTLSLVNGFKFKPAARLCGDDIEITEENCEHFYYVKKADMSAARILEFHSDSYGEFKDGSMELLHLTNDSFKSYAITIGKTEFNTTYFFYPKPVYGKIYKDYLVLLKSYEIPGKRALKKMLDLLRRNKVKSLNDTLNFKKAKRSFNKIALYYYYKRYRNELFTDPQDLSFTLAIPANAYIDKDLVPAD